MKFYISLNDYEALEVEGKLINEELEYDRAEETRTHIDNGLFSTQTINAKGYKETWEVNKADGTKEELICNTRYEDGQYRNRICDSIMELVLAGKDLSEYGKIIDKNFIGLLSTQEIVDKYGINESTVRKAIMEKRLKEGTDCKKFGTSWVVREEAAKKLWG